MKKAIESMNNGKAAGCSGLPIDLIKHLGESGVDMMHETLKRVWEEEQMPEEWKKSEIVPIYKQKGDTQGFVLYLRRIGLEKAYDRVPMNLVYWCLRRRGVPEKQVEATVLRTTHARTDEFPFKVCLHQ